MDEPLLNTKLYMPRLRPKLVSRPRLLERLKAGLQLKLTLVAAPAGYGKTTLLSEGFLSSQIPVGWLTLDNGDNDATRFWVYVTSALQTVQADIGKSALGLLQSPQAPPIESIITTIINDMSEVSEEFALVLDNYHMIEAQPPQVENSYPNFNRSRKKVHTGQYSYNGRINHQPKSWGNQRHGYRFVREP